ncbi:MAG TPA: ABC transporter permease [Thermomicrobiales bacterium]|nr:ABC transporter permease [Thermomicrobiales bacterium]
MKPLLHMILANYRMTVRNRMALFWNIAFPVIFIVLFGFLFTADFNVGVGIVGADTNEVSRSIADQLEALDAFDTTTGEREDELQALEDGDRSIVVVFEEGAEPGQVSATLYYDNSDPQQSQIALSAVQQYLQQVNLAAMEGPRPVEFVAEPVASSELRYIDFLVPGIVAMSLMNSGLIGLASAFVSYREKGILRRIKATPFPLSQFIVARIVSQLTIAVVQATILIGLAKLLFDLRIDGNLANVMVMVLLGAMAFISLGFVISSFAKNQEAADALANAVSFPMLFLAGVFFPVEAAPAWLQPITRAMPLRYLADGMRDLMVRGSTLPDEWFNILVMLLTAAIGLLLSMRLFKWESSTA